MLAQRYIYTYLPTIDNYFLDLGGRSISRSDPIQSGDVVIQRSFERSAHVYLCKYLLRLD